LAKNFLRSRKQDGKTYVDQSRRTLETTGHVIENAWLHFIKIDGIFTTLWSCQEKIKATLP